MTFFFISLFMVLVFWRPQDWLVPAMYGWPILDAIFYIAMLTFLMERDQRILRVPTEQPQFVMLGGLFIACIMSHVAHTYFQGIINTVPEVFKICFFTAVLICVLDSPRRLRAVAVMFVAMSCLMAVHAILQETRGYGFAGSRPMFIGASPGQPAHTRSFFFGIFEDPNDMAQILATSIPFAFAIPRKKSVFGLLFALAVSALLVRGIMTTHSQGGKVALAAVTAVMFVLMLPSKWLPFLMGSMVVGALFLCPFSAAYLDQSAYERVVFWGLANQAFKSNLFFGIGYGMFWIVASSRAAHNAFVSCYTEIGLFGYFFWYGLLQLAAISAWRTRIAFNLAETDDERWMRRFAGLAIAALMGFSASAYFLSRTFVYPFFFLCAILGALPVVARNVLGENKAHLAPRIDWQRDMLAWGGIGTIGSILYIYISIILLNAAVG